MTGTTVSIESTEHQERPAQSFRQEHRCWSTKTRTVHRSTLVSPAKGDAAVNPQRTLHETGSYSPGASSRLGVAQVRTPELRHSLAAGSPTGSTRLCRHSRAGISGSRPKPTRTTRNVMKPPVIKKLKAKLKELPDEIQHWPTHDNAPDCWCFPKILTAPDGTIWLVHKYPERGEFGA